MKSLPVKHNGEAVTGGHPPSLRIAKMSKNTRKASILHRPTGGKKDGKKGSLDNMWCGCFWRKNAEKTGRRKLQLQPNTETFRALKRLNHMCMFKCFSTKSHMPDSYVGLRWDAYGSNPEHSKKDDKCLLMFTCPYRTSLAVTNPKPNHPRFRNGEVQVVLVGPPIPKNEGLLCQAHRDVNLSCGRHTTP